MSLLQKIGSRVPAVAAIEQAMSAPTKRSYEALRSDLWKSRAEFWIRRTQNVPVAFKAARAEGETLFTQKLSKPESWTYGDLVAAGVVATQLFGCFCIGEIVGRGSVIGQQNTQKTTEDDEQRRSEGAAPARYTDSSTITMSITAMEKMATPSR